jgi:integrase
MKENHADIEQRIYRGKIDRPKTTRSRRLAALSPDTRVAIELWRAKTFTDDTEAWVFTSEKLTTPMGRDNLWRRDIEPKLKAINLDWVNFQVMRRTHASLSRKAGIDPKLVADQLGHGLGVNLDVYTISDLGQRLESVNLFEESLTLNAIN